MRMRRHAPSVNVCARNSRHSRSRTRRKAETVGSDNISAGVHFERCTPAFFCLIVKSGRIFTFLWYNILYIFVSMLKEGNSHGNIVQVFFMTLTGALFGYTYVRSGKIAYSIVLHMLCNISSLLNILTGSTDGRPVAE